jgi:elongation factor 2
MYMGAFREVAPEISSGNIAALLGLDLGRAGETLTNVENEGKMYPFETIKYVSEPVVTIAVEPKYPRELPKLVDAMNRLSIEDPNLVSSMNKETGEYLLSGMGELHLEIAVKFLRDYGGGFDLITSRPIVVYRESTMNKGVVAMAKSPNKHSRFWIQVEPLEEKVIKLIEKGEISEIMNRKKIGEVLYKEAKWSAKEARNVWAIEEHKNMMLDLTKGHYVVNL